MRDTLPCSTGSWKECFVCRPPVANEVLAKLTFRLHTFACGDTIVPRREIPSKVIRFCATFTWVFCASLLVAQQQTCPVNITRLESSSNAKAGVIAALANTRSSSTWLILNFQNVSDKQIAGARFTVVYLNSVGEAAYTQSLTTPSLKLKPGKTSGLIQADDGITGGQKVQTVGSVNRVMFSDGTMTAAYRARSPDRMRG